MNRKIYNWLILVVCATLLTLKGGARAYNHRLNSVAMQRMYGKSSAKFKSSRGLGLVWLNSHYHTKVPTKKKTISCAPESQQKLRSAGRLVLRLWWKSAKPAILNIAEVNTNGKNRQTCLDEMKGQQLCYSPAETAGLQKKPIQSHNRFCTLLHCNLMEGSRPFALRELRGKHTNFHAYKFTPASERARNGFQITSLAERDACAFSKFKFEKNYQLIK